MTERSDRKEREAIYREAYDAAFPKWPGDVLGVLNIPSPWEAFVAGFNAGRASVIPSRERLAAVIYYQLTGWDLDEATAGTREADTAFDIADAILALLAVPSTENEATIA